MACLRRFEARIAEEKQTKNNGGNFSVQKIENK
jgi:hypothetical protein